MSFFAISFCLVTLFQGHVACQKFTLTAGPPQVHNQQQFLTQKWSCGYLLYTGFSILQHVIYRYRNNLLYKINFKSSLCLFEMIQLVHHIAVSVQDEQEIQSLLVPQISRQ